MLEYYFKSPTRMRQLRRGPMGEHIDDLAAEFQRHGYCIQAATLLLRLVGRFSQFARMAGIETAGEIDEALIDRFFKEELAKEGLYQGAPAAMGHMLELLRRKGVIERPQPAFSEGPNGVLLSEYDDHMTNVRGLAANTREGYLLEARRLCAWFQDRHGGRPLKALAGRDVLEFISVYRERHPDRKSVSEACQGIRAFIKYLHGKGITRSDLSRVVPRVPRYRLSGIPRHLPWEQVRALIDGIDATTPSEMRNKAILLLVAALGLRNGEIRMMQLEHIDWKRGLLKIPLTKSGKERILPLPHEVGAALADYILHGRPVSNYRFVFLHNIAPYGPISSGSALNTVLVNHLVQIGIDPPRASVHMLRHSLATRMVNIGVPIKDIADILGHSSIDTTAIYTKVDLSNLRTVALPFPGEASS